MDYEKLIQNLIDKGWSCHDHFLNSTQCLDLIAEANSMPLKQAHIGNGAKKQQAIEIRNDSIFWLDEKSKSAFQKNYFDEVDKIKDAINRELYLGLKQFEGHFALYQPEGFYKKHLDQFANNHERLISIITYLNSPEQGGELRLYKRDNPEEIDCDLAPRAGMMVCFLSNQIYHEVLPTMKPRYAITGWLRSNIK